MFGLNDVQTVQLIGGLFLGVVAFTLAYILPTRFVVLFIILSIPFQLIESRFGTSNMVITYLVGVAFLLKGGYRYFPLFGSVVAIIFAYLMSLTQVHHATLIEHAVYIIGLGSGFIVFYIAYNFAREIGRPQYLINVLIALNVLIVGYCFIQLLAGYETVSFGSKEIGLIVNREDQRLQGPFYAVGLTAELLVLMIFIIAFQLIHERMKTVRILLYALMTADMAFLIATGNRGGVLVLIGGILLFLFIFRKELGLGRILTFLPICIAGFSIMSFVIINHTDFNQLYTRLEQTELEHGMPDTRAEIWPIVWEAIKEKPIIGHGPRLRLTDDDIRRIPGHTPVPYPHNLYLFLLCTVGSAGLLTFLIFIIGIVVRIWNVNRLKTRDAYLNGLVKLGPLLLLLFLIDQIKMEFLRFSLLDYQHFVFMLMAIVLAIADMARERYYSENSLAAQGAKPI